MTVTTYNIPFIGVYSIEEESKGIFTIWVSGCKGPWRPFESFVQAYNYLHREILHCVSIELGLVREKEQQLQALQRHLLEKSIDAYKQAGREIN